MGSIKKTYVDGPFGQIHVRVAQSTDPTHPGVAMFHQSPNSGQIFRLFQPQLARDRIVDFLDQ